MTNLSTQIMSAGAQNVLVWQYFRENWWTMSGYLLVVLILFPLESVLLPRLYSGLFDAIRTSWKSLPSLFTVDNITINFRWDNPASLFQIIIGLWLVLIGMYMGKHTCESTIIP